MKAPPRVELTRREVNLSLLAAAFTCAAGTRAPAAASSQVLFDFAVAGGNYHALSAKLPSLSCGQGLTLVREPHNPFDANAIAVQDASATKLGYLPRRANQPIAQLLDEGRTIVAEIVRFADFRRGSDLSDDLVFTDVASGDPVIRLTLLEGDSRE